MSRPGSAVSWPFARIAVRPKRHVTAFFKILHPNRALIHESNEIALGQAAEPLLLMIDQTNVFHRFLQEQSVLVVYSFLLYAHCTRPGRKPSRGLNCVRRPLPALCSRSAPPRIDNLGR